MHGSLESVLRDLGGVAHIQDLLKAGLTRHEVARFHRTGELLRPRIGWYVATWQPQDVVRAVRVGGVLDCVSAAKSYGCIVPDDNRVHVALPGNAARLRSSGDGYKNIAAETDSAVVRHWTTHLASERFRTRLVPALDHVLGCLPGEWAVGVVDSARRVSKDEPPILSHVAYGELTGSASAEKRRLLRLTSERSESILESVVRVRLVQAGYAVEEQVPMGSYRADLLVGGRVVVECDGFAFHGERETFERDRRRDAVFAAAGYQVLRLSYRRVTADWKGVLADLQAMTERSLARIR